MKLKVQLFVIAALSAAAFVAAVFGSTSSAAPRKVSKGTLVSLRKTALGKVLVDARGHTLYLFAKDKNAKSACYGTCATYWPAVVSAAKPRAGGGVRASLLRLTRRTDGRRQVTYAGHPLYRFILDKKPGQTAGEGLTDFGASWNAVASNGRGVGAAAPSSGGGYGSGYGPRR
jgi:predicted lipoprotein with Yx(FWY)xxD motif